MTPEQQRHADRIAGALRPIAPDERLMGDDVARINAMAIAWDARQADAPVQAGGLGAVLHSGLSDSDAFFASLRQQFGAITQGQVDGVERLLKAMGADQWPLAWTAYGLATPWWETNKQMHPVEEGYYLGGEKAKRHQRSLRYYPWYGRGDVQLTWEENYRGADEALGLNGELIRNPDLALDPEISARILVWGMRTGAFTKKKLATYLPQFGPADRRAFQLARWIINGQDKASEIADIALKFQRALQEGQWS